MLQGWQKIPAFWHDGHKPFRVLSLLAKIYYTLCCIRKVFLRQKRAQIPVICIGNLTIGGAGKTPVALAIADQLQSRDWLAHIVLRGYRGNLRGPLQVNPAIHNPEDVGDEALMLSRVAPTWIGARRILSLRDAHLAGAEIAVLDDGLQHYQLHKDFSILVVDGGFGFGNGHVLPAGPLREPLKSLDGRIDAAIIIDDDRYNIKPLLPKPIPILHAKMQITIPEDLHKQRILAFCGIGRPKKFFDSLKALDLQIIDTRAYADHYRYSEQDMMDLITSAKQQNCTLLTTEKDFVRLSPSFRNQVQQGRLELKFAQSNWLDILLTNKPHMLIKSSVAHD